MSLKPNDNTYLWTHWQLLCWGGRILSCSGTCTCPERTHGHGWANTVKGEWGRGRGSEVGRPHVNYTSWCKYHPVTGHSTVTRMYTLQKSYNCLGCECPFCLIVPSCLSLFISTVISDAFCIWLSTIGHQMQVGSEDKMSFKNINLEQIYLHDQIFPLYHMGVWFHLVFHTHKFWILSET